jgi:hypothetical protein
MADVFESYDSYYVGQKFPCFTYTVTEEKVKRYIEAVQDQNLLYLQKKVVPPALAAVYTRWPMITGMMGRPGTIHAKQQYQYYKSIPWNATVSIYGEIIDKYIKKNRKYVVQQVKVFDESGSLVTVSKATIILPE